MTTPIMQAIWPSLPPSPTSSPTVLHLPRAGPRTQAREATRWAAQATLEAWCGEAVTLRETATGPRPAGPGAAMIYRLSFTYAGADAWIAFHRGPVGVDACPLADFPERAAVTRLYLPAVPVDASPATFARNWARLEATLKLHGLALTEAAAPTPPRHLRAWTTDSAALALAWA
jgi:hypothetical protein